MGSDETRAKITVNDTLTIKQVLQGVWRDFDVQGVSLEADGDRLLIASNLQEALDTYQRIEAPSRALREKMSFVLWNQGSPEAWEVLGDDCSATSEDGVVMELRALAATMLRTGADDEHISKLVDCVLARGDEFPNAHMLLASAIYCAVVARLDRSDGTPVYPACCDKAVSALQTLSKPYAECMEVFALTRRVVLAKTGSARLTELIQLIDLSTCPVLGFVFAAAIAVQDLAVARRAVIELCKRFPEHPNLIQTVAMAAIQARDLQLIEALPASQREECLELPEIRVLEAMVTGRTPALLHAIKQLPNGFDSMLRDDMAIHERLLKISWRRWDVGTWRAPYSLLGEWGVHIAPLLPVGDLRDKILLEASGMAVDGMELLTPLFCELFNRKPNFEHFNLLGDCLPLDQLDPSALAQYIFDEATAESPYCSLFEPEFEVDLTPILNNGVPDLLVAKSSELSNEAKTKYLGVLTQWGLIKRPESVVAFEFERRLMGSGLPVGVADHLQAIRAVMSSANGTQLVYLQSMLEGLAGEVGRATPVASAEGTVAAAINEILSLRSHHLNEVGLKRVSELTKRYSASRLLVGLRELAKVSTTTLGTDVVDALANHMVRQQGSLTNRRSYLAAILRKRLVNLRSNWLDQQVSDCMNRGIDIEQMITLAKGVATWDDWSQGLEKLRPY
ncbi:MULTISPECIES: hypothetical protein [Pseudomonas]|jgi:hypothetical protein|uniref:hypothetical protein n=1 Tax=Pseudomonas TaxID=286 RepID=UPI0018E715C4|nr:MULTISPECIES: hypothetical protein [Pseudomonas]MBJ2215970.1 hypothetical protein [Pseudomonas carnis]MBP5948031.1 hypothetical protein [Pseudomonas sp. P9(2020)]